VTASRQIAAVYNQAGDDYVAYADGDPERLFCFDGLHGYADRCLWSLIEKKLDDLRTAGASSVTILDAGCGPGTWPRCMSCMRTGSASPKSLRAASMSRSPKFKLPSD
jgi:hypothetical protein